MYQHSCLLGDFVWVFILKSEHAKRIVLLLKYLGHFMGLPVPDPKGVFWRYYQSYLDEISCFFLLYFVKFYFPFSLKNLWWIQSVFYFLNLWWIQSVFYILNLWWIQSVFICSSYLSPSFIIIAFFYLLHFLSSSPLPLLEVELPTCWWPGTYCVYFPLSLDTVYNTDPSNTRLEEKPFLSLE